MSPLYFPRTVPCSGASFLHGVSRLWFPRFHSNMKHSDFLPPFPRRLVPFASRYRRCALGSLPRCRAQPPWARDCLPDFHNRLCDGDDTTSQVHKWVSIPDGGSVSFLQSREALRDQQAIAIQQGYLAVLAGLTLGFLF